MDVVYFLTRYIPFWAVPVFLIGGEFAYLFWVRKKQKWAAFCFALSSVSALSLVFYFWVGGPEKSVQYVMKIIRFYSS